MSLTGARKNAERGVKALGRARLYFNAAASHLGASGHRNGLAIGAARTIAAMLVKLEDAAVSFVAEVLAPKPRVTRRKGARK